jgi:hypothetical protein
MSIHLSDDQFVDRLYGIASEDDAHLDSCPVCQTRWSQIQQRRDQAATLAPQTSNYFRQQRSQIHNRLAQRNSELRAVWVPAAFVAFAMVALLISRTPPTVSAPAPVKAPVVMEVGWFEDHYAAMGALEPRAASTVRELFEEGPVVE